MQRFLRRWSLGASLIFAGSSLSARVAELTVESQTLVAGGRLFGDAGAYEELKGSVKFAVDPKNPHDAQIVDLQLAPKNSEGLVECATHFVVFRPKDPRRANGALLLEIPNRGRRYIVAVDEHGTKADFVGGLLGSFLFEQGYTVAWVGWQADLPKDQSYLGLDVPVARQANGAAITGLVRADFTPWDRRYEWPLGHVVGGSVGGVGYPSVELANADAVLTVRAGPGGHRQLIPNDQWQFARWNDGRIMPDPASLVYSKAFEAGRTYEIVYKAENPRIAGLGLASTRDFVSYLKYDRNSPIRISRAYAIGASQSGRFLRHFLYQDFNADELGQQVFDGLIPFIAGAGRGSFNHRFAQPSRDASPLQSIDYPTDLFPFTDTVERDSETGAEDGLLQRAEASHTIPRIFLVNTSYEYWSRAGSLIHTTIDGRSDIEPSANVRIYFLAGVAHVPGNLPPGMGEGEMHGQHRMNPNPQSWFLRALLTDLDAWVKIGTVPPPSRYPQIRDHTLVAFDQFSFPALPSFQLVPDPQRTFRLDFGPSWSQGQIVVEPPRRGRAYAVMVPTVNSDGNEVSGVQLPELAVPLATYTGWDLRDPPIGASDQRSSFVGAYLPFPRTREERTQTHDPRLSIAERYASKDDYLIQYRHAAEQLVKEKLLLASDLPEIFARAELEWVVATTP